MAEHGRGNTPLLLVNSVAFELLLALFVSIASRFVVHNFVKASKHVAACDVFKRETSLHEQTALWNSDGLLLPLSGPDRKAWVTRLAVDCQESDIVVKTCKHCACLVELLKVRACRGQQVSTAFHFVFESVFVDAHAESGHF